MLVIIDSITDLYKLKLNPKNKKHNVNLNHLLNQILANLHHLNQKYNVEILLVNELSRDKEGIPVLSGGKVMNYWVSYALQLKRTPALNKREALLSIPGTDSKISFELDLTEKGFRFTQ
jgi:RecA/RadA recombinase